MSSVTRLLRRPFTQGYYYGWVIVGLAFLSNMLSAGTGGYGLGVFITPMQNELGWSTTTITFGQTIKSWINGLTGPVLGTLLDRFGPRKVMLVGALLGGVSLAGLGWVHEPWQYYLLYSGSGAIGVAGFSGLITNATIAKWFVRKRGQAMSWATMGVSTGGSVLVPVTQVFISLWGWRVAWMLSGVLFWVLLVVPTWLFMRDRPEDMGVLPDGEVEGAATAAGTVAAAVEEISWTLKEALRQRATWIAVIGFNLGQMGLSGMIIHNPRAMILKGFSPEAAAGYAALFALLALLGKPIWGYFMDRFLLRYVIMGCYLASIAGIALLLFADHSPINMTLYAVVFGFCIGATPMLAPMLWSNYYGRRFAGTIQGTMTPFQVISGSLSPLYAAWIADLTGSYDLVVWTYMVAYVLAAIVIFFAVKPVYQKTPESLGVPQ